MTDSKPTLRTRLAKLRSDPRVAAFSLIGPGGQVFDLVNELVAELEAQQLRVESLERRLAGLGALRVNPIDGGR